MRAVGILGSPRKYGNTAKMLDAALSTLENSGFEIESIFLPSKNIKYCMSCGMCLAKEECPQKDDMAEIKRTIEESDAVILASPVYYLNVTAQIKTFIDRMLSYGHRPTMSGKYGGSIVVYAGVGNAESVAAYLNTVLRAWGVTPVGSAVGFGVVPGEVKDADIQKAKKLGENIAKACAEGYTAEIDEKSIELQKQLLNLIRDYGHLLKADYEFWKRKGVL